MPDKRAPKGSEVVRSKRHRAAMVAARGPDVVLRLQCIADDVARRYFIAIVQHWRLVCVREKNN